MANKLRQSGFTRIRPLLGGLDAWIEAGMPVEEDPLLEARAGG